jgi:hypothetical protein
VGEEANRTVRVHFPPGFGFDPAYVVTVTATTADGRVSTRSRVVRVKPLRR